MQIIVRKGAIQAAVFLQQRENVNENNILLIAIILKHLIEFLYQRLEFLVCMSYRQDGLNHYSCMRGICSKCGYYLFVILKQAVQRNIIDDIVDTYVQKYFTRIRFGYGIYSAFDMPGPITPYTTVLHPDAGEHFLNRKAFSDTVADEYYIGAVNR